MTTKDTILKMIASQVGLMPADIDPAHDMAHYGADSLDEVEIIIEIETKWGFDIEDNEAEACKSIGDLIALVERKVVEGL